MVELHAYSVTEDTPALRGTLDARLHELYPETAAAGVVHESTLCRSDCPRLGPGDFANRPTVATTQQGLVLAGDGIRIDLPVALMERARDHRASSRPTPCCERFGVRGHDVYTVPVRGRSAVLRRLADRVEGRVRI